VGRTACYKSKVSLLKRLGTMSFVRMQAWLAKCKNQVWNFVKVSNIFIIRLR
jgi:hypothetical protein